MALCQLYTELLIGVVPAQVALYPSQRFLHALLTGCLGDIKEGSGERAQVEVTEEKEKKKDRIGVQTKQEMDMKPQVTYCSNASAI